MLYRTDLNAKAVVVVVPSEVLVLDQARPKQWGWGFAAYNISATPCVSVHRPYEGGGA